MASVNFILRQSKLNKAGEAPLYLRVIKDRKTRFVSVGLSVLPELWDSDKQKVKSKHPNSARANAFLATKLAEAQNTVLSELTKKKSSSTNHLKQAIQGKPSVDFFEYADKYKNILEANEKYGTHIKYSAVISKLKAYHKPTYLPFDDIDVAFLTQYEQYLRDTLENSINTIHGNLKILRKLFNDAVREELIEANSNPFLRYKLKTEKTRRNYLTSDELLKIENLDITPDTMLNNHRNMFVFASYAGGIRISDLLQLTWQDFDGTHIRFTMQKTAEPVSVKLPTKALQIIAYYKPLTGSAKTNYIFPILSRKSITSKKELQIAISGATAYVNKNLKDLLKLAEINKPISFHCSRHGFAVSALQKGIRIEYVGKLLGQESLKTTQIYAKIVNSELDKAMDVFN
jgi:site-specific recombinase XerD